MVEDPAFASSGGPFDGLARVSGDEIQAVGLRDQLIALDEFGRAGGDDEASGGFLDGDVGTAERPAAAESEVHAKAEFFGLGSGEGQVVEELGGEVFEIAVDLHRVSGLYFKASDAALFHLAHFAL